MPYSGTPRKGKGHPKPTTQTGKMPVNSTKGRKGNTSDGSGPFIPRAGDTYSIYMSRADIGSGVREFIVISARNEKRVVLFWPARLRTITITRNEWDRLIVIAPSELDRAMCARRIMLNAALYSRNRIQYNRTNTLRAITLLEPLEERK